MPRFIDPSRTFWLERAQSVARGIAHRFLDNLQSPDAINMMMAAMRDLGWNGESPVEFDEAIAALELDSVWGPKAQAAYDMLLRIARGEPAVPDHKLIAPELPKTETQPVVHNPTVNPVVTDAGTPDEDVELAGKQD